MRESVRLQKSWFYKILQEQNKNMVLLLSYHAKTITDFKDVDVAVVQLLKKIMTEL